MVGCPRRSPWLPILSALAGACQAQLPSTEAVPVEPAALQCQALDSVPPDLSSVRARVVLISIDGLRPDAIVAAPAPRLKSLACGGSFSFRARTIIPSLTLPSHSSMVSGFPPSVHGLLHNDLQPGFIQVPTFLSLARAAGKRVVLVVGKEKLVQLAPPDTFDVFVWATDGDGDVASRSLIEIQKGFDALFIHFPMVDVQGHVAGWMSPSYLAQVAVTDAALGRVLDALPSDAVVIVTADHGGHSFHHNLATPVDVTIPWIIAGPGIRRGHSIAAQPSTMDTAATAARVLGLDLPSGAVGRPVTEPFEP